MSIGSAKKWIPICHCYLQALAGVGRSLWRLLFSKQSRLNSHTLREYLFSLAAAFPGGAVVKKAKATSPSGAAGGKMDKLCVQRWKCTPGWAWVHVLLFFPCGCVFFGLGPSRAHRTLFKLLPGTPVMSNGKQQKGKVSALLMYRDLPTEQPPHTRMETQWRETQRCLWNSVASFIIFLFGEHGVQNCRVLKF